MVGVGAVLSLQIVWSLADIAAALMAIPNLIALLILVPEIKKEVNRYKKDL
jgi:AGCS family alanine or glycine:cation symporter